MTKEIRKERAVDMMNYRGSGMCVMEISHRSKDFMDIAAEAALLDALNSGKVCAANLDVLVDEKNPNRKLDSHSPAPTLYV